jgi:hypothetical protein
MIANVANGVWIAPEPDYDSPINRGSHCLQGLGDVGSMSHSIRCLG